MLYDFFKRLMDIIGSIIGIIVLSPFLLLVAILIKLDSDGPIFADTPMRVGVNGQLFHMFKFRSMVVGAYEILKKNTKLLRKYKKNNYKLEIHEDPRITSLGRFIRKTSI